MSTLQFSYSKFYTLRTSVPLMDQGMNLDIGELEYNPSARDLSDAKVHHMLSDDLWKPTKKVDIHLCINVITT